MTSTPPPPAAVAERGWELDQHGVATLEQTLADIDALRAPGFPMRALRLLVAERLVQHRAEVHDKIVEHARRAAPATGDGEDKTVVTDVVSGRRLAEEQARANGEARKAELLEVRLKEVVQARDSLRKALKALTVSIDIVANATEHVGRSGFVMLPADTWRALTATARDIRNNHGL